MTRLHVRSPMPKNDWRACLTKRRSGKLTLNMKTMVTGDGEMCSEGRVDTLWLDKLSAGG